MKSNEIAGVGNHNTALFWEYDTRLGRRWNRDSVTNHSESPYASFSNSPISKNDELGNTAEPVVNKGDKTITFQANIYLYGDVSKEKMSEVWTATKNAFDEKVNSQEFTSKYDGEDYKVNFNIKIFTISTDEALKLAKSNKSQANNFVRVEDVNKTSYFLMMDQGHDKKIRTNVGVFTTGDLIGRNKNAKQ